MVTLGILVPSLLAFYIPHDPVNHVDYFSIQNYWRVIFLLPVLISAIQMIWIWCYFNFETPLTLTHNKENYKLVTLIGKMYHPDQLEVKIAELVKLHQSEDLRRSHISFHHTFFDKRYRRATWIGCALSMFQNLSGINIITFYSA